MKHEDLVIRAALLEWYEIQQFEIGLSSRQLATIDLAACRGSSLRITILIDPQLDRVLLYSVRRRAVSYCLNESVYEISCTHFDAPL